MNFIEKETVVDFIFILHLIVSNLNCKKKKSPSNSYRNILNSRKTFKVKLEKKRKLILTIWKIDKKMFRLSPISMKLSHPCIHSIWKYMKRYSMVIIIIRVSYKNTTRHSCRKFEKKMSARTIKCRRRIYVLSNFAKNWIFFLTKTGYNFRAFLFLVGRNLQSWRRISLI